MSQNTNSNYQNNQSLSSVTETEALPSTKALPVTESEKTIINDNSKIEKISFFNKLYKLLFSEFVINSSNAKKLAYLGVFTALSVVLNFLSFNFGYGNGNKLSFLAAFGFLVGSVFGCGGGFIIMFIGDAIGVLLKGEVYNIFIGLGTALFGGISGIICLFKPNNKKMFIPKVIVSFIITFIVCTCVLNTYGNYLYCLITLWGGVVKKTFWVYFIGRIIAQSIVTIVNLPIAIFLCYGLDKIPYLKLNITGINNSSKN